jgi:mono/diheme cytochrome c family protein
MTITWNRGGAVAALLLICTTGASAARADRAGAADAGDLATADGRQIYTHICQGCHMPQGQGAEGAGHYPALAGNPALVSWQYVALTVLKGRRNMPAFSARHAVGLFFAPVVLSDAQIAAVINYVRTHFGNDFKDTATADQVHALDP